MGSDWKTEAIPGFIGGLPEGYRRIGSITGRGEFLEHGDAAIWSQSDFTGRAETPNTTSSVEAALRRRHLERIVSDFSIDPGAPTLELGCADGLVTHQLLALGFDQLVSTDIDPSAVAKLEASLDAQQRERVLLLVDDLMRLPLTEASFETVIAWGVLSVSGDFERALKLAWSWLRPGGSMLLAEPLQESVLVYTLVRGDIAEFDRTLDEGTRAAMWDRREDRYPVWPSSFFRDQLERLPGSTIASSGGVSMLPSVVLGGLLQDSQVSEAERGRLVDRLLAPELDELVLWRQGFWLVRKA